jgi:hypothetical protein
MPAHTEGHDENLPFGTQIRSLRMPDSLVGEIVVWFSEQADWCSCHKATDREIYNLVLGPVGDQTILVAHLEEVIGQLKVTQGEQGGLKGSAS